MGFDAPEEGQAFGNKAKQVLSAQILGKQVIVAGGGYDRHRRLVSNVYIGSTSINAQMINGGWAWHDTRSLKDQSVAAAQAFARKTRLGLWAGRNPVAPWEWRRKSIKAPYTGYVQFLGHGTAVPDNIQKYIKQTGILLVKQHMAIGITVPKGFYYRINYCRDKSTFIAYSKKEFNFDSSRTGGFCNYDYEMDAKTKDLKVRTQHPLDIVCYNVGAKSVTDAHTIPTLIHEMCHAIHGASYGEMPLWLQEGISEWYSERPQHLGDKKKAMIVEENISVRPTIDGFTEKKFYVFLSCKKYEEWDFLFERQGGMPVGYVLSKSLIDFLMNYPQTQKVFKASLIRTRKVRGQRARSIVMANHLRDSWPGGLSVMLKGWKSHHAKLATSSDRTEKPKQ